jgi:hypothetical protein
MRFASGTGFNCIRALIKETGSPLTGAVQKKTMGSDTNRLDGLNTDQAVGKVRLKGSDPGCQGKNEESWHLISQRWDYTK